jgi:hypothetical protein
MVLYTKHVLPVGKVGKLRYGNVVVELAPTEVNSALVSDRELIVVRVNGLPAVHGAGHAFPAVDDTSVTTFDEVKLVYPDKLVIPDR